MSVHEDRKAFDAANYNPRARLGGVKQDNESWKWDMYDNTVQGRLFAGTLTILTGALIVIFA